MSPYAAREDQDSLLTIEEENELHARYKRGDKEAAGILAQRNMGIVYHLAGSQAARMIPHDEAVGIAFEALARAIARFDPAKGRLVGITSFLFRNMCADWRAEFARPFSIHRRALKDFAAIGSALRDLRSTEGADFEPSDMEIAAAAGVSLERVHLWRRHRGGVFSLNQSLDQADAAPGDWVEAEVLQSEQSGRLPDHEAMRRIVSSALAQLSPKERQVMTAYYGLNGQEPVGLKEIGLSMGLTLARIGQIENKARAFLRKKLAPLESEARLAMAA